jgi:hypothetical protein
LDAVLGAAVDGGWWIVGMKAPRTDVFAGVPPSRSDTGARQLGRLQALGLQVGLLDVVRDVDTWEDALAVGAAVPSTAFGAAVAELSSRFVR